MNDDAALDALSQRLARLATHHDITGQWPAASLDHLTSAGAWTWVLPEHCGGLSLDPLSQTRAYEAVAAGCMSTALILTQRDGACELIAAADNEDLKESLLPRLARHEVMTSVGISQLTTSHRSGRPALSAVPDGDGFVLQGFMPWVTSAPKCQFIVTGAVLPDDRQILAAVPTDLPGLTIDSPMKLAALQCTATCEVHLKSVRVSRNYILRGPVEHALASRSPVKPLVVATCGIGLAGSMVRLIQSYVRKTSGELAAQAEELTARYDAIRQRLLSVAASLDDPALEVPKVEVRVAVNDLLMRLAIGTLTFAKGTGFLRQMDAQRLAREALFFLVWSAPEDVRARTLAGFLRLPPPETRSMER